MKLAVIGPGAMGLLFGARLAQQGHEVYMVGTNPATLEKLEREGIDITWQGVRSRVPVHARLAGEMEGPVELAMLFTKTTASRAALEACGAYVGPETWMLSLQNGLGNLELLSAYVPRQRLLLGVTGFGSDLEAPGRIVSAGAGYVKLMAVEPEGQAMAERVNAALNGAGLTSQLTGDVMTAIWEKVALNAALNAICGVCQVPCGGLRAEDGRQLARILAREACAVANAAGVPVSADAVLDRIDQVIFQQDAAHYPSMAHDLAQKRPSEVEAISGAIWRKARELGMEAPYNEAMYRLIKTIEANY